jgi:phage terminase large subunit GpA-like protein
MTGAAARAARFRIARETRRAIEAAVTQGIGSLRAEPPQRLSDWAEDHFKLAGESSHQKGAWESWPFQVGWMDAFSNDDIEHVDVQKSKRVGYTKTLVAFVAYNIAHRRRKQALWQPTDDDRDSFVKSEIDPILDPDTGVPAVRAARRKGKGADDTIKYKAFRDSVAHFLGGKAARAYRRITVAVVLLDEWSAFDQLVEKSGDPGTLARGRLEGAPYPKFVGGSTPRIKGLCHVERSRLEADADLRYHVACPRCGVEHPLFPGDLSLQRQGGRKAAFGFKWEPGKPGSVRHVCPHCREAIAQGDYLRAWVGAWVCIKTGLRYGADRQWRDAAGNPVRPPRHVAFQVWAAYSPQRAWDDIVREFEEAKRAFDAGDSGPMTTFVNETLGETFELVGDKTDEHELQKRAEKYDLSTVPVGALLLTAGFDLQGNRGELGVWGWGPGMESWAIDHHVIEGNPQSDEFWDDVWAYLTRRYVQAWHGGTLGIDAVSLDANYQTQAVLNFVRSHQSRMKLHAIRGDGDPKKPIKGPGSSQEVTWRGQKWPNGTKLWTVGVKQAKDLLHGQLGVELAPGGLPTPGYVHTSNQLPREWYEQLTAEQRILVSTPTGTIERWVKRRPRNEVLDTRNYAAHAAYMLGVHKFTDARWAQIAAIVQPPRDLFTVAPSIVLPLEAEKPVPAVPPALHAPAANVQDMRAGFGRAW